MKRHRWASLPLSSHSWQLVWLAALPPDTSTAFPEWVWTILHHSPETGIIWKLCAEVLLAL